MTYLQSRRFYISSPMFPHGELRTSFGKTVWVPPRSSGFFFPFLCLQNSRTCFFAVSKLEWKNLELKRIFLLWEASCGVWVSGEKVEKTGWLLCTCDSSLQLNGKPSSQTEPFTPAHHLRTSQKQQPGQVTRWIVATDCKEETHIHHPSRAL